MFRANRMLRVCMSKNKEQITFYEYVCQRTKSNSHVTSMYVKEQRANHMLRVCMLKNKEPSPVISDFDLDDSNHN